MKSDNFVIGIGSVVIHDSNVAAVSSISGPLFASSEERYTRVKKDGSPPTRAYAEATSFAPNATVAVSYANPKSYMQTHHLLDIESVRTNVAHVNRLESSFGAASFEGHHRSHAAGAFYTSGFEEAYVFTYDAGITCEPWMATIWYGKGDSLTPIRQLRFSDGADAALKYSFVTWLLGFRPIHHEGKVTGLAAHETPSESCIALLDSLFQNENEYFYYDLLMSQSRPEETKYGELVHLFSREQWAATIQYIVTQQVLELMKAYIPNITQSNCALAGGLFANVRLNQAVKELGFLNLYVYPAMGDEGLGLGAALSFLSRSRSAHFQLNDVFLGSEYSNQYIEELLIRESLEFYGYNDIDYQIAELLSRGYSIARFTGRMEYGPRALGNRSILQSAGSIAASESLNASLQRSDFMPFAPASLAEDASKLYAGHQGMERSTRFMTTTLECTELLRSQSPAVVHADNTARPQIVTHDSSPSLYRILASYRDITGISSLINTSFNLHEEPIVRTPEDAVRTYLRSRIDYLAIGNFLLGRPEYHKIRSQKGVGR